MRRNTRPPAQTTLASPVRLTGIGVHSGRPAVAVLHPAGPDHGIVFRRQDLGVSIPARHDRLVATELCTVIGDGDGASVSTIEHLMSALAAFSIDNLLIEVDGPEMPIVDGSAAAFVDAIRAAGVRETTGRRSTLRVVRPVRVESGDGYAELVPFDGCRFDVTIDFASASIPRQSFVLDLSADTFRREIAAARTFGFVADVARLRARGFVLGSSLDNSIGVGEVGVLNPEGLRWPDEFVRHKTLDAVGDLALLGMPFRGMFRSYKGGHRLNALLVRALVADRSAFEMMRGEPRHERSGAGLMLEAAAAGPRA